MLLLLPNTFGDAALNMAIDGALLKKLPAGTVIFRHYGWTEPAVTFGYAQEYAAVQSLATPGIQLCRRMTGGGIVDHRNDWTYSLLVDTEVPAAHTPATDFYKNLHRSIQTALETLGIASHLAPCPCPDRSAQPPGADQCFVAASAHDVLRPDDMKIAGAAMKRTREGLLVQGSIDRAALPGDFDFSVFTQRLAERLADMLDLPIGHPEDVRALYDAAEISRERERFAADAWNKRR